MTENKPNIEETLDKVMNISFKHILEFDKSYIDHLETHIDFIKSMISSHIEKEPLKLFKNKHLKWEKELKKWNDKLSEAYQNLNDAIIEQETFM